MYVSLKDSQRSWHSSQFKVFQLASLSPFLPFSRICTAGDAGWAAGCNVRPYGPAVLLGLNVVGADVPQDGRDGHLFGGPGPAAVLKTEKKNFTTQLRRKGHCRTSLSHLGKLRQREGKIPIVLIR